MEPHAALVSPEDQRTIIVLINIQRDAMGFDKLNDVFGQTHELLMRVAQCSQPIREVQMVCNHTQLIIDLRRQITDLLGKQFQPPQCNCTELEQRIQTLTGKRDEACMRLTGIGTDQELRQDSADISRDAQQSEEGVRGFRTQ